MRTNSPYERLIEEICPHESSAKIKAVDRLITIAWAPGDGSHNLAMSLKKDMENKMKELKKSETLRQQTRIKHMAKNRETKANFTNMRAMANEPLDLPDPSSKDAKPIYPIITNEFTSCHKLRYCNTYSRRSGCSGGKLIAMEY